MKYPEILLKNEVMDLFGFDLKDMRGITTILNIPKVIGQYYFNEKDLMKLVKLFNSST